MTCVGNQFTKSSKVQKMLNSFFVYAYSYTFSMHLKYAFDLCN